MVHTLIFQVKRLKWLNSDNLLNKFSNLNNIRQVVHFQSEVKSGWKFFYGRVYSPRFFKNDFLKDTKYLSLPKDDLLPMIAEIDFIFMQHGAQLLWALAMREFLINEHVTETDRCVIRLAVTDFYSCGPSVKCFYLT